MCWKFQQSRVIVCAVITFWAQCTESLLFNLYPYWAHFWSDSMNDIIHISAENCFIVTNSKVNRSRQRYPFTEEIIVFIKPDIFVSEWSKEGADSIYTPCRLCKMFKREFFSKNKVLLSYRNWNWPPPSLHTSYLHKFYHKWII